MYYIGAMVPAVTVFQKSKNLKILLGDNGKKMFLKNMLNSFNETKYFQKL